MNTTNKTNVTATRESDALEPAVGGRCTPRVSSSPPCTKISEVASQASGASQGAGNATGGKSAKQALPGGRQAIDITARPTTTLSITASRNGDSRLADMLLESSRLKRKSSATMIPAEEDDEYFTKALEGLVSKCKLAVMECDIAAASSIHDNPLQDMLRGILSSLVSLAARRAPRSPNRKKAKDVVPNGEEENGKSMEVVTMEDSATQTESLMTTSSSETTPTRTDHGPPAGSGNKRKRAGKKRAKTTDSTTEVVEIRDSPPLPEAAPSTPGRGPTTWSQVVSRKTTRQRPKPTEHPPPDLQSQVKLPRPRAPAVLVKVKEGKTYMDVVQAVKTKCPDTGGAKITAMRRTRAGDLLIEFGRGKAANLAADRIRTMITDNSDEDAGSVVRLSPTALIEVVDIDAAATKEEVLTAIQSEVKGAADDLVASMNRKDIRLTGLWHTKRGQQVATVIVPRDLAASLRTVKIGWISCRVRLRAADPPRCHRCHGFGHSSSACNGPDLAQACRRCGEDGHQEKTCPNGADRCVACDRAGLPRTAHRPGSAACGARKEILMVWKQVSR